MAGKVCIPLGSKTKNLIVLLANSNDPNHFMYGLFSHSFVLVNLFSVRRWAFMPL